MSYAGINLVGLQRSGFSQEQIKEISDIYHLLFVDKHTTSNALILIESTFNSGAERDAILHFVKSSKSGIIRRPSKTSSNEDNPF
jgi:UDP-N-acetylglucosamine acyltransferase